jgi:hypothetical protein
VSRGGPRGDGDGEAALVVLTAKATRIDVGVAALATAAKNLRRA